MQTFKLVPHPQHPPTAIGGVQAHLIGIDADRLHVRWRVEGARTLVLPAVARAERADGLWRTTCFEVFLRPDDGDGYIEWNLSPSGRWNVYDFAAYREGMRPRSMPRAPETSVRDDHGGDDRTLIVDAALPLEGAPPRPCRLGICVVIEEAGGIKSYWALAHPAKGPPDFHAAAGFAAQLGLHPEST